MDRQANINLYNQRLCRLFMRVLSPAPYRRGQIRPSTGSSSFCLKASVKLTSSRASGPAPPVVAPEYPFHGEAGEQQS